MEVPAIKGVASLVVSNEGKILSIREGEDNKGKIERARVLFGGKRKDTFLRAGLVEDRLSGVFGGVDKGNSATEQIRTEISEELLPRIRKSFLGEFEPVEEKVQIRNLSEDLISTDKLIINQKKFEELRGYFAEINTFLVLLNEPQTEAVLDLNQGMEQEVQMVRDSSWQDLYKEVMADIKAELYRPGYAALIFYLEEIAKFDLEAVLNSKDTEV